MKVNTYDFIGEAAKAVPYGVYDLAANSGWVNVGTDADTGEFAVESIRRWWNRIGAPAYPDATRLLITCLLYTSPSPRDRTRSRMPSSA